MPCRLVASAGCPAWNAQPLHPCHCGSAALQGRNLFLRPLQGKVQSALARMRPADAAAVQARLARLAAEAGAELPFGPEPPHGGTPAQRAPPLAPVLVRHKDGQVEWRLTGSHVFMSGLLPSASLQDLCSMIEGAGGTGGSRGRACRCCRSERHLLFDANPCASLGAVNQSRMERGDRRGDIAYIRLASATQAAMIIERLQRTSVSGCCCSTA